MVCQIPYIFHCILARMHHCWMFPYFSIGCLRCFQTFLVIQMNCNQLDDTYTVCRHSDFSMNARKIIMPQHEPILGKLTGKKGKHQMPAQRRLPGQPRTQQGYIYINDYHQVCLGPHWPALSLHWAAHLTWGGAVPSSPRRYFFNQLDPTCTGVKAVQVITTHLVVTLARKGITTHKRTP